MQVLIKFGTDGWRGIIAEDFTFENVRACAHSVAFYLKRRGLAQRGLVVGYDTRFASEDFAQAVAEVVTANGIPVLLCPEPAPTPVVTYTILDQGAGGAVIITASHNSAKYNGFKYKPEYAGSASPEICAEIEAPIPAILSAGATPRLPLADAEAQGLLRWHDPAPAYIRRMEALVEVDGLRQAGLRVVADAMYGAGAGWFPRLLAGGSTQVWEIHGQRNPLFPGLHNPEPIARNLGELAQAVSERKAQAGLATDGDADRIGLVDGGGQYIGPLHIFSLLAYYLLELRGLRGPIIKTVPTSHMIDRLGELYGVPVYETPVGFKYVGPLMMETDALLGGEESGGFGFRGYMPERDGILSGLFLLDLVARAAMTPSAILQDIYRKVGPHHYDRIDITLRPGMREGVLARVERAQPERLAGLAVASADTVDGFRYKLEDGSWLLLRFSGTEPLLRIYSEAPRQEQVERLLQAGRELAGA
ncbi:MAG TPA: phosphoglucomutase/phosphomannomutase family protein [Dehalococcoidia bacterium]|nr:phosphoglucomutase/phosphomannomutase family protein [Dehalococcoidia bacterium]